MNDVRPNRLWEIQYGGHQTGSTFISACGQDRNEISTAMSMLLGSSYPMELVVMLIAQTGSGEFSPLDPENIDLAVEIAYK